MQYIKPIINTMRSTGIVCTPKSSIILGDSASMYGWLAAVTGFSEEISFSIHECMLSDCSQIAEHFLNSDSEVQN